MHVLKFTDPNDIISVAVLEWHVTDPAFTEEILNYYTSTVGPMMCSSPTVLRFRFCEIEDAVEQTNDTNFAKSTKPMHKYFSIAEMAEESWPWDVIVEMAEDGKWAKYFESQTVAVCFYPFFFPSSWTRRFLHNEEQWLCDNFISLGM